MARSCAWLRPLISLMTNCPFQQPWSKGVYRVSERLLIISRDTLDQYAHDLHRQGDASSTLPAADARRMRATGAIKIIPLAPIGAINLSAAKRTCFSEVCKESEP